MLKKKWELKAGSSLVILTLLSLLCACDSMEEDSMPSTPNVSINDDNVYVLANGTTYIDLYSKIQTTGRITMNVSNKPEKGQLSEIGKGLLKYKPSATFKNGKDTFTFSVFSEANELITEDSVVIIVGDTTNVPCGIYPSDDWIYSSGTPFEANVLWNDHICGDSTDILLEIFKPGSNFPPYYGTASVTSTNQIRYISNSVEVVDTVVYKLSRRSDKTVVGYGSLYINVNNVCMPYLPDMITTATSPYPAVDSLFLWLKPGEPMCGVDYADSLSVVTPPKKGNAILEEDWIWYVYELTQEKPSLRDSLVYRWCNGDDCVDGRLSIKIN